MSYRNGDELLECLHSLSLALSDMHYEVIVVQNDTRQKHVDLSSTFPVREIQNTKNIGFGAAANIGARKARSGTLFFLNPDTQIIAPSIREGLLRLEESAIVGLGLLDASFKAQKWSAGYDTHLFDIALNNLNLPRSGRVWNSAREARADWVSGGAFLTSRDTFLSIGGFDEEYFLYFEDMDLCRRIRQDHGPILFLPHLKVIHEGGKSFKNRTQQKKYYYTSQLSYFRKNRTKWEYRVLRLLHKLLKLL